jgi:hypothetical protein
MKSLPIIALLCFWCCTESRGQVDQDDLKTSAVFDEKIWIEVTGNESEFPKWVKDAFPKDTTVTPILSMKPAIHQFVQLNDSVSFVTYSLNLGTNKNFGRCLRTIVQTYKNQLPLDSIEILKICDQDPTSPKYRWKMYSFTDTTRIAIKDFTERVPDSLINKDGRIDSNINFIYTETILDSTIHNVKLTPNGNIRTEQ